MPFQPFDEQTENIKAWSKIGCDECKEAIIVEVEIPLDDGNRKVYFQQCDTHVKELIKQFADDPKGKEVSDAIKNTYDLLHEELSVNDKSRPS